MRKLFKGETTGCADFFVLLSFLFFPVWIMAVMTRALAAILDHEVPLRMRAKD